MNKFCYEMETLKTKFKEMLVSRLKLDMSPDEITDDMPLFGDEGLGLDSIDALELVVGIQKEFGISITDKSVAEKVLLSVNTVAAYIMEQGNDSA